MINISITFTGFQTLAEVGDRVDMLPPLIVPAVLKGWRTKHTARGIRSPTRRKTWRAVAAPQWGPILVCGVRKSGDSSKELMSQIIFPGRVGLTRWKRAGRVSTQQGFHQANRTKCHFINEQIEAWRGEVHARHQTGKMAQFNGKLREFLLCENPPSKRFSSRWKRI